MPLKKILTAALAVAALGAAGAASAQHYPPGVVGQAAPPPPPRFAAGPRPGHAWVPGHWEWRRGHRAWIDGHWARPVPRGARYGGRDRDRDGVPDRYDRRPGDPYRR
ncbi:MAG: hypothetical protein PGN26_07510 [Xylophilus ampelinus]